MPETRSDDGPNEFGHGSLHKAVIHNNVQEFKNLLKNGHNVNEKDELGFAPLHLAVLLGRNDIITAMIRIKNEGLMEMTSCKKGVDSGLDYISKGFIDVDVMNCNGQTPLDMCIKNGQADTLSLLLQLGCSTDTLGYYGVGKLDDIKEVPQSQIAGIKKNAAPIIITCEEIEDLADYKAIKEVQGTALFDVVDGKSMPESKEVIASKLCQSRSKLNENLKLNNNVLAIEAASDSEDVRSNKIESRIPDDQKQSEEKREKFEQDSIKNSLSNDQSENICCENLNMESTCHGKEHCRRLEYYSNPHQKLDCFEMGYMMNKGSVGESSSDGNPNLSYAAGECFEINSKAYLLYINPKMIRKKHSTCGCTTPEFKKSILRNSRKSLETSSNRIASSSTGKLNTIAQNYENLRQLWRSYSSPNICYGKSGNSDLVSKQEWVLPGCMKKNCFDNVKIYSSSRGTEPSCFEAYKAIQADFGHLRKDCQAEISKGSSKIKTLKEGTMRPACEFEKSEPSCVLYGKRDSSKNRETVIEDRKDNLLLDLSICGDARDGDQNHLSSTNLQKPGDFEAQNKEMRGRQIDVGSPLDLWQTFTEINDVDCGRLSDATGDIVNESTSSMLCYTTHSSRSESYDVDSYDSKRPAYNAQGNNEARRHSKDSECGHATESSPIVHENAAQCYCEGASLASDASGDVKTVTRGLLQFTLNGKKLETYDIDSTLSFDDSLLEKVDELDLRSQSDDTIVGGYKLCSDCLLRRKINCIDTAGDGLNVTMGASQSNNISPVNDLWEVWELNNNKNDCKKEWNSPNRTSIGRRQSTTTLSFRSRSLPDIGIAECNSIVVGDVAESFGCILPDLDRPHSSEEDTLRRQSLPDPSSFPSWLKESHSREEIYSRRDFECSKKSVASGESRGFELQENYCSDKEENHSHIEEPYVSLSSYRASSILDSDLVIHSQSPLISPVHNKPDLPYLFCENIYHIRSDSDLQGKYLKNYRKRAADDTILSKSTSYLSQCILDEVVDYFPCKDDSHLSMTPMHQCYDWSLCIEPLCEHDRNHLTVSVKSKDEDHGDEPAYSYICSENEDLEGSFICSDCGTTVPHMSLNKNGDHSFEGSVDVEKGSKANDEFVLICVPGTKEGNSEETGSSCGSLAVYHRDDSARSRRLSGVHGSLENIEETDVEKDYEEFEQLGNNGCKMNGKASEESKKIGLKNDLENYVAKGHSSDAVKNRHYIPEDEKIVNQEVAELDKRGQMKNIAKQKDVKNCKSGTHAIENGSSTKSLDGTSVNIEESKVDCQQKKGKNEDGLESRSDLTAKDPDEAGKTFTLQRNSDYSPKGIPKCVRSLDFDVFTVKENGNVANDGLDELYKKGKVEHGLKQDEVGGGDTAIGNEVLPNDDKILVEPGACLLKGGLNGATNPAFLPLEQQISERSGGSLENEKEKAKLAELRILDHNTLDNAKAKSNAAEPINLTGHRKQNVTLTKKIAQFEESTAGGKDEVEVREQMGREGNEDKASLAIAGKETEEQFLSPLPLLDAKDCLHSAAIFPEVPEKNVLNYNTGGLKAALHTDVGQNNSIEREFQSGINMSALGLRNDNEKVPVEVVNGIAEIGTIKSEAKSISGINRRFSKCKRNYSISEYESLDPETHECSCDCKGTSYGCLQCSCERGISQSTSESLLSADTGIDVDDASLTDWETFNQCLDFGSLSGDHCNCDRRKRISSTPVCRRASVACIRGDVTGKGSFQRQDVDGNNEGRRMVKSQSETFDLENLHLRTSSKVEAESREINGNVDHDFAVVSSQSATETNRATDQETPRFSDYTNNTQLGYIEESALIKLSATKNEKNGTMVTNYLNEGRTKVSTDQGQAAIDESHQRKLKKYDRDTMALLRRMAKKAKSRNLKESGISKIKLFASEDNNDLHLKLLVLNFEGEEAYHNSSSKKDCQKSDLANAKTANLNSAIELIVSKGLKDFSNIVINCFNYCGNGKRVNISDCWFLKVPKILAAILIAIAERSEQLWTKTILASIILSNVCKYKTCQFSAIINWLLIQLKFIKSESRAPAVPNARATLMLLCSLIQEPYFELSYLRQLAYVIARPRVLAQDEEVARREFLWTCLRIEIRSFAFSCKYAFKIFVSVQMLLTSLEDELKTAFEALDKHLVEYMHNENCLDFVSDVLMYLGLLKSEFQVNVTNDLKTCIKLLAHIARQEYFPLSGIMVLDAFLNKPNKVLKSAESQKAELDFVLHKRIKEGLNKSTELT